jgi:2-oxoglutarate ferredoxin oxidoreductase subunit alpha
LEELGEFARYRDVDGDGIPYRTLPGNDHPLAAWFARGTGHNDQAIYSERPEDWTENMARLWRKHDTARDLVPAPIIDRMDGAEIGLIGFGSTLSAIEEARSRLAQQGIPTDFLRLRAVPFNQSVAEFVRSHDRVYVVEMNTDAQMCQLLQLDMPDQATKFQALNLNDGLPLTAKWIVDALLSKEGK